MEVGIVALSTEPDIKPGKSIPMDRGLNTLYEVCRKNEKLFLEQIFRNPSDYYVDSVRMRIFRVR